jgi:hypothetical protein
MRDVARRKNAHAGNAVKTRRPSLHRRASSQFAKSIAASSGWPRRDPHVRGSRRPALGSKARDMELTLAGDAREPFSLLSTIECVRHRQRPATLSKKD